MENGTYFPHSIFFSGILTQNVVCPLITRKPKNKNTKSQREIRSTNHCARVFLVFWCSGVLEEEDGGKRGNKRKNMSVAKETKEEYVECWVHGQGEGKGKGKVKGESRAQRNNQNLTRNKRGAESEERE